MIIRNYNFYILKPHAGMTVNVGILLNLKDVYLLCFVMFTDLLYHKKYLSILLQIEN